MRGNVFAPVDLVQPIETGHPLLSGLIGHWLGPAPIQSSAVPDALRRYHAARVGGTATSPPPAPGMAALRLDGTTGYVVTSGSVPMPTSYALAIWVKPASSPTVNYARIWESDFNNGFYLGTDAAGAQYLAIHRGSAFSNTFGTVAAGVWTHLCVSYSAASGTASCYVNGALARAFSATAGAITARTHTFGRYWGGGLHWPGDLADAWLWGRALSAEDVASFHDQSRRGHPDTLRRSRNVTSFYAPKAPFQAAWRRRRQVLGLGIH